MENIPSIIKFPEPYKIPEKIGEIIIPFNDFDLTNIHIPDSIELERGEYPQEIHIEFDHQTGKTVTEQEKPLEIIPLLEKQLPKLDPQKVDSYFATYKGTNMIREIDETMMNILKGIKVVTDQGNAHDVPVMYATASKVNAFLKTKLKLPLISIHPMSYHPGPAANYKITFWSIFNSDMNQMIEQLLTQFTPTLWIGKCEAHLEGLYNNFDEDAWLTQKEKELKEQPIERIIKYSGHIRLVFNQFTE